MAADLTTVLKRTTEILNACLAGTFSVTVAATSLDRSDTAISEACRGAALLIASAIVRNPDHPHRNLFVPSSPTALTHGGALPNAAGHAGLIEIRKYAAGTYAVGVVRGVHHIEEFRLNTSNAYDAINHDQAGSKLGGYYALSHGRIYFTGNAARGYFPIIDRTTVTTLVPDEYETAWVALTVWLCLKEGDNMLPIAQEYARLGEEQLKLIELATLIRVVQLPLPIEAEAEDT